MWKNSWLRRRQGVANGIDPAHKKVEARQHAKNSSLTLARLIDRYLEEGPIDRPDKRPSSWANDKCYLNNHARPLLGSLPVADIRARDISKFQNDVMNGLSAKSKCNARGRKLSGGRGAAVHAVRSLSAAFGWAVQSELIPDNPCNKIEKLQDGVRERYLSFDEARRLFNAIDELLAEGELSQTQVDCVSLISYTAARAGEIKGLRWEEVDFDRKLLILPPLRHKTGGTISPKVIPLTATCVEILMRRQKDPSRHEEFVFPSKNSASGILQNIRHSWKKITKRAGLGNFRIHDFRHAYASFAINSGQSLKSIGANLGHRKSSTTERYAHLLVESRRPVAEGIEAIYKSARST